MEQNDPGNESRARPNVGWSEAVDCTNPATPRRSGFTITLYDEDICVCQDQSTGLSQDDCPTCKGSGVVRVPREELKVPPCEQRIKGQFEQWVRAAAERKAIGMSIDYNQEMGQRALDAFIGAFGGGAYNWDGRHCRNAREDIPGQTQLLFLLLKRSQPLVTLEEVEDVWFEEADQCLLAIRWALGNSRSRRKAGANGAATNGTVQEAAGSGAGPTEKRQTIPPSSTPRKKLTPTLDAP